MLTGESVKSFVRECYHLSYQLVNSWCAMVVDFVTVSNTRDVRRSRIVRVNSNPPVELSVNHFYNLQKYRS